jgi:hypothetical protein
MNTSTIEIKNILKHLDTMTLTELNATASYLKRIDTKFLLKKEQLKGILEWLKDDFKVLEIAWNKVFSYDNIYMDTDKYLFYNQHQEKYKSRTKIRTRYYQDNNLAFFEYKQKDNGITRKFRYQFPTKEHWIMTKWKKRFFEWVWQSIYEDKKAPEITPSIKTEYKRITLVSKEWSERLTIDFDIRTKNLRKEWSDEINLKNLVIIESKTLSKNCKSLKFMKKLGYKKAKSCSKYSLWIIYAWLTNKFDTFKETIAKIKEIRVETLKNRFRKTDLKSFSNATDVSIFKKENIKNIHL